MAECSFCGENLRKGSGLLYVKRDGKPFYYCSSKCKKNALGLKREGRRKRWTKSYKDFLASKAKKSDAKTSKPTKKKK